MSSYRELKAQLQDLHRQAEIARHEEKGAALETIRGLIVEWRLLPSDLGFTADRKTAAPAAAAKYRDPATGTTWSGRGRAPKWLAGQDRAAFEIH